jgi:hypothetical protein
MLASQKNRWLVAGAALGLAAVVVLVAALTLGAGAGAAAAPAAPTNVDTPTVTGTAANGQLLTAHPGRWDGADPIGYSYVWLRCADDGTSCAGVSGATDQVYLLKNVDVGTTLRVRVTATNAGGSTSMTSGATDVISKAPQPPVPPTPTGCPPGTGTVNVADVASPARLVIDQVQFSPSVVGRTTQTVSARVHVADTCGQSVAGALVYGTAIPFNQLSIPGEQTTGQDGWAFLEYHTLAGFPVTRFQQLIVVFLRARKPGENLLAGISTRRLVSTPVNLGL